MLSCPCSGVDYPKVTSLKPLTEYDPATLEVPPLLLSNRDPVPSVLSHAAAAEGMGLWSLAWAVL